MWKSLLLSCLMLILANLAMAHQGIHEQVDVLSDRLKKQPNYQLYAQRAHLYFEGGQYDLALKDLDKASKMGPKEPLLFEYGNIYLLKGDAAKALMYFNQFINFNDKFGEVYQARAKAHQKLGQTAEAIQDLKRSFQLQQSPHPGLYIEASNLIYSNKTSNLLTALDLLDEGIKRLGVQGQLQEHAIKLLLENNRSAFAAERMLLLGSERNHNVFWRFDYAQLLVKAGRKSDAQLELKRALRESKGIENAAVTDLRLKISQQLSQLN